MSTRSALCARSADTSSSLRWTSAMLRTDQPRSQKSASQCDLQKDASNSGKHHGGKQSVSTHARSSTINTALSTAAHCLARATIHSALKISPGALASRHDTIPDVAALVTRHPARPCFREWVACEGSILPKGSFGSLFFLHTFPFLPEVHDLCLTAVRGRMSHPAHSLVNHDLDKSTQSLIDLFDST